MRYVTLWIEIDGYRQPINMSIPIQQALSALVDQAEQAVRNDGVHWQTDYEEMRLKYVRLLEKMERLEERWDQPWYRRIRRAS